MRISALLVLALGLAGCADESPQCHFQGEPDIAPSAGCLVVHHGRMLLVETRNGKFTPPGGTVSGDESPQCAAERETWEETGVEVQVESLFHRYRNGFHLYWCSPVGDAEPVRSDFQFEVGDVGYYSPEVFDQLDWRFPTQVPIFTEAVKQKVQRD